MPTKRKGAELVQQLGAGGVLMPSMVISRLQYTTKIGGTMEKKIKLILMAESALKKGEGEFHIKVRPAENHSSSCSMTGAGSVNAILLAAHSFINAILNVRTDMSYEDVLEVLDAMNRLSEHHIVGSMLTREETP